MSGAMRRAIGGASAALAFWVLGQIAHTALLCAPHRVWQDVRAGRTSVVLERGEQIAGPGDVLYVCETTHRTGPVTWHQDLQCYCGPAGLSLPEVSRRVGGSCTVDNTHPSLSEAGGSCRFAHCSDEVSE